MASPTWWTWVWVSSGSWWWTGRPGVQQSGRKESDMTEQLNWTEGERTKGEGGCLDAGRRGTVLWRTNRADTAGMSWSWGIKEWPGFEHQAAGLRLGFSRFVGQPPVVLDSDSKSHSNRSWRGQDQRRRESPGKSRTSQALWAWREQDRPGRCLPLLWSESCLLPNLC